MIAVVRIDDALWDSAHRSRRDDWRVSIIDLVDDARLGDDDDHVLHVAADARVVSLSTFDASGAPLRAHEVPMAELRPQLDEYLAIIRRMHGDQKGAMHALDMAKKVVHDAGAKTLARVAPGLARDHESFRRLFSLILAVVVDVTALPHRRHGR